MKLVGLVRNMGRKEAMASEAAYQSWQRSKTQLAEFPLFGYEMAFKSRNAMRRKIPPAAPILPAKDCPFINRMGRCTTIWALATHRPEQLGGEPWVLKQAA